MAFLSALRRISRLYSVPFECKIVCDGVHTICSTTGKYGIPLSDKNSLKVA
jgi:hypothetical protein